MLAFVRWQTVTGSGLQLADKLIQGDSNVGKVE